MKLICNSCDGIYNDSLDVRFTKACDNDCPWCIERRGVDALGRPDPEKLATMTELSGKRTVLILGGEPFLEVKRLARYVELIRDKVENIYITTSVPPQLDVNNPTVVKLLGMVNGLNVSLHSVDWRENNTILHASNHEFNRVKRLRGILNKFSAIVRVSVNLDVDGVNSREKLDNYLARVAELGCVQVKVNELQDAADHYVSFNSLYPELRLGSPFANGCQTSVDVGQPRGLSVLVKRSCFVVNAGQAGLADFGKAIARRVLGVRGSTTVLYENGELSDGWLLGGDLR